MQLIALGPHVAPTYAPGVRIALLCMLALAGCDQERADPDLPADAAPTVDASPDASLPDAGPPDAAGSSYAVDRVDYFSWVDVPDGRSEPVAVELPDDVSSLTLVVRGEDDFYFYVVGHLEGPDGRLLVAEGPPHVEPTARDRASSVFAGPFISPNRSVSNALGVASMLAPNNPGVTVGPGVWHFRVLAADANRRPVTSRAQLTALIKRGPAPQVTGSLDLHLHFTGAHGWSAASAAGDADLQRAIARMRGFYGRVGVALGEITYEDIPQTFRTVDSGDSPISTLGRMFALGRHDTGVNLFFVERINSVFGDSVVAGIAGGTPGPSLHGGTSRSGVAVATSLDPDPDAIGHIMAHETGHYLGLFHTIEVTGAVDQIDDTGEGRDGDDNLMFPTVTRDEAHLSDGQGWVLHRNASIRPTDPQ